MSRGVRRGAACAAGAALVAALLPAVGNAWTTAVGATNAIQLDPGTCGQMLKFGSDPTASSSARPTFLLSGDGGLSSYAASIDGTPIGTFSSDGRAVVCIAAP